MEEEEEEEERENETRRKKAKLPDHVPAPVAQPRDETGFPGASVATSATTKTAGASLMPPPPIPASVAERTSTKADQGIQDNENTTGGEKARLASHVAAPAVMPRKEIGSPSAIVTTAAATTASASLMPPPPRPATTTSASLMSPPLIPAVADRKGKRTRAAHVREENEERNKRATLPGHAATPMAPPQEEMGSANATRTVANRAITTTFASMPPPPIPASTERRTRRTRTLGEEARDENVKLPGHAAASAAPPQEKAGSTSAGTTGPASSTGATSASTMPLPPILAGPEKKRKRARGEDDDEDNQGQSKKTKVAHPAPAPLPGLVAPPLEEADSAITSATATAPAINAPAADPVPAPTTKARSRAKTAAAPPARSPYNLRRRLLQSRAGSQAPLDGLLLPTVVKRKEKVVES
ncbi:hypothetical protein C8A05DRAFT_33766 [Staphylotrichum tortipilum]|uniref:Uncharacterized protein n=1 Tax=Staphylotrichum tortipilum TaxID=2831512 RepID=A0AAN6MKF2_9PEZI|nr:hypothetical protein C8A05DRAFT_33766 [Staphylotrichum longicolle]